jgi:hypothetical protein
MVADDGPAVSEGATGSGQPCEANGMCALQNVWLRADLELVNSRDRREVRQKGDRPGGRATHLTTSRTCQRQEVERPAACAVLADQGKVHG